MPESAFSLGLHSRKGRRVLAAYSGWSQNMIAFVKHMEQDRQDRG